MGHHNPYSGYGARRPIRARHGNSGKYTVPTPRKKLQAILTYHVVAGKVLARDVMKLKSAKTVNGKEVKVSVDGKNVMIDGANVVKTDILCGNGVIHVIDAVILP